MRDLVLSAAERAFTEAARRAVLTTITRDGRPRPVPICFALDPRQPILYTPLDEKPKTTDDPMRLARVTDILADPRVVVLVDQWAEDWARLAWVRMIGGASLLQADADSGEHGSAVAQLRSRYPQYAAHDLAARPVIRIAIQRTTSWGALDAASDRGRQPVPSAAGNASSSSPGDTRPR
jgi:PPOX class probable F420-dependent enzyme